jgi:hypothetical protein
MWWLCVALPLASADLVINEILYDPEGPDTGREFVELYNPGSTTLSLADLRVLFINGSTPDASDEIWRGEPTAILGPGEFFVLGGEFVSERDRTVNTGLQNGDEALEIWRGAIRLDAVAWGNPPATLGEGRAVEGVAGQSLGRVPDGLDRDDNARDFRPLPEPTPGRQNLAAESFSLAHWWSAPAWREDDGQVELRVSLIPTGWADVQRGTLRLGGQEHALRATLGDTLQFGTVIHCEPGLVPVDLALGTGIEDLEDVGPGAIRCGVAALVFTEIQPRPLDGEPEWFEIHNRSAGVVRLDGWGVRDRGGRRRNFQSPDSLEAGERVVVSADATRLREHYPASSARFVELAGAWPTLNDTDPGGDVSADSLYLLEPENTVADLVSWRSRMIEERGRPLQRGEVVVGELSLWLPATAGATPGEASSDESRVWPERGLECRPDPFVPGVEGVTELEVLLVGAWTATRAAVFDLRGDLVRELDLIGLAGRAAARWDGRDQSDRAVPPGAYVVVVEAEDERGSQTRLVRAVGLGRAP